MLIVPDLCFKILANMLKAGPQLRKLIDEAAFLVAMDMIVGDSRLLKSYALSFLRDFFLYHDPPVSFRIMKKNPDLLDFLLGILDPESRDMILVTLEILETLLRLGTGWTSSSDSHQNPVVATIKGLESAVNMYKVSDLTNNTRALEYQSMILEYFDSSRY